MYVIYTTKEIGFCKEVYDYFIDHNISFSYIILENRSKKAKELLRKYNFLELPLVFKYDTIDIPSEKDHGECLGGCYSLMHNLGLK